MIALIFTALATGHAVPQMGWHDEFRVLREWKPLDMQNRAKAELVSESNLTLSLGHVPTGWPYQFQWSGVKQDVTVNVAKYPILAASVGQIHGYAHLDVDILDAKSHPVKTLRSTVLNVSTLKGKPQRTDPVIDSGVVTVDLGKELLPATYRLQIRLIVGGENSGCSATYHWIRSLSSPPPSEPTSRSADG